jgi:putative hemin transport protein
VTPLFPSEALFGGRREIGIAHGGQRYVLRITRQGKLILNKAGEAMSETREKAATQPLLQGGIRARDLAESMGIREAELLATHQGPEVVRLKDDMRALIEALPDLGEIMSLTRNDAVVHEKVGRFGNITLGEVHGLVLNKEIDQRLFLSHWRYAFAVELPGEHAPRRSLQVFDEFGDAVVKVHLRASSNLEAFEAIRARFRAGDPAPLVALPQVLAPRSPTDTDAEAFRREFDRMQDVHEFFPLLKRHALTRRGALDLLDERYRRRLLSDATRPLLERAAEGALAIMCFVGSRGCIQIHSGPVKTVKTVGPWLNILDEGFNLHLREDMVAEVWAVQKPTRDGAITSVELYDRDGGLIAQFFGVREPEKPENPAWRALVATLPEEPA